MKVSEEDLLLACMLVLHSKTFNIDHAELVVLQNRVRLSLIDILSGRGLDLEDLECMIDQYLGFNADYRQAA